MAVSDSADDYDVQLTQEEGDELVRQRGCRKALDHAASIGMARQKQIEEAQADREWVREHLNSYLAGLICGVLLVAIVFMVYVEVRQG